MSTLPTSILVNPAGREYLNKPQTTQLSLLLTGSKGGKSPSLAIIHKHPPSYPDIFKSYDNASSEHNEYRIDMQVFQSRIYATLIQQATPC